MKTEFAETMAAEFQLHLTGGFRLTTAGGAEIRLSSRKGRAIFAILGLSPGLAASRAKLRGLLWGERGEQQAADSLRQQLAQLRKELGAAADAILAARDDQVGLVGANLEIDVQLILGAARRNAWTEALSHYGGPLLDGLDVGDEAFEQWLSVQRHDLTNTMVEIHASAAQSETGTARIALAERLVDLDPLREASHRVLIQAAVAAGDAALARKHYEACVLILRRELGVTPAPETAALLTAPAEASSPRQIASLPSIAVLPFTNLSDAPDQRYFSDGVSADIATELQRFRDAVVRIASRAASADGSGDPVARGRSLAANFVVTGSVRRMGPRLRLTVQLVDVDEAAQLWSEKFDATESDIFDIQDSIVQSISAQLAKRLRVAAINRAKRKPPQSLAAYELVLRGEELQVGEIANEAEAARFYEEAAALDPTYGRAHAGVGFFIVYRWLRDYDAPGTVLDAALESTRKAVGLDDNDAFCHLMHAQVLMFRKQHELALHHFQRSLALNPNDPMVHANNGIVRGFIGDVDIALAHFDHSLILDPHYNESWYWRDRGVVHFVGRQYDLAIGAIERSPTPQDWSEAYLAACYAFKGDFAQAAIKQAAALRLAPKLTISAILSREPYKRAEDRDHLAEGMRLAGFT